jgi:hypothetical protein
MLLQATLLCCHTYLLPFVIHSFGAAAFFTLEYSVQGLCEDTCTEHWH